MSDTKATFKPATQELADKIAKHIKIDAKTGIADAEHLKTVFVDNLPEGLTKEHVEALDTFIPQFAAASYLALGEASVPVFKKHKNLDAPVTIEIPTVGKSKFVGVFERSSMVRAPGQEPVAKFGTGSMKLDFYGMSATRGEFKKVRDHLTDLATSALSD
jgi:hypothetical protein